MDNQRATILVLLDLIAAFDTVNINILTETLKQRFNINDTSLKWLISYLTDRKQRVKINNYISKSFELQSGVPQGS